MIPIQRRPKHFQPQSHPSAKAIISSVRISEESQKALCQGRQTPHNGSLQRLFSCSKGPSSLHTRNIHSQHTKIHSCMLHQSNFNSHNKSRSNSLPTRRYCTTEQPLHSTQKKKKRVCIVGSGPAGFYSLDSLQKKKNFREAPFEIELIDLIDKCPLPYGLVRFGVAADHPEVKAVSSKFDAFFENNDGVDKPKKRFFGGVQVGRDVQIGELRKLYDVVILATGCPGERKLNIPGEEEGRAVYSARDFVGFLNGDFDFSNFKPLLSNPACQDVAVIGNGNVALDIARILLKPVAELERTDISDNALAVLAASKVKRVHLIGRRGVVQANWTAKELREQFEIAGKPAFARQTDILNLGEACQAELGAQRSKKRMHELFQKSATLVSDLVQPVSEDRSGTIFRFLESPVEVLLDSQKDVTGLRLQANQLQGPAEQQRAAPIANRVYGIPCGAIFRSVGYLGAPFQGVPFDAKQSVIPNEGGRVGPGLYVTGWAKRGPSGIVGTNKFDSDIVVDNIFRDFQKDQSHENLQSSTQHIQSAQDLERVLKQKAVRWASWSDWKALDHKEQELGKAQGRPRIKLLTQEQVWDNLRISR